MKPPHAHPFFLPFPLLSIINIHFGNQPHSKIRISYTLSYVSPLQDRSISDGVRNLDFEQSIPFANHTLESACWSGGSRKTCNLFGSLDVCFLVAIAFCAETDVREDG
jgi:hypothetical protein